MKKKPLVLLMIFALLLGLTTPPIFTEAAVKLSASAQTICVGTTLQLTLTGTSNKVTWTSSNKKVATVNAKGLVKGKKKGTATITAAIGKQKKTCKITVKKMDSELKTAFDTGLLSKKLDKGLNQTITYKECSELLYRMLSRQDKSAANKWKKQEKLCFASDRSMKRDDAMLLFYSAAQVLGWPVIGTPEDYHLTQGEWEVLQENMGVIPNRPEKSPTIVEYTDSDFAHLMNLVQNWWDNAAWNYPCFPNWEETDTTGWGTLNAAFIFAMGQRSYISNRSILDFDKENLNLPVNLDKKLTIEAAARAAVRLSESAAAKASASEIESIYKEADTRKSAIMNSPTTIEKASEYLPGKTYSGTAYYVSNDGNDENNGLTPETAFQTVQKINFLNLKKGDAVFFRRGDIWREWLICKDGVTYSAYGEGRKPRFYGSKESGVGAEKWKLYYTGSNGEKIWKYYRDMPDTGGIIFNDGESYALRVYSWWSTEKKAHVRIENTDRLFAPEERLLEGGDLIFCSLVDFGDKQYPIERYNYDDKGGLYLRCDKGNPGTLYHDIEFENSEGMTGWGGIVHGEPTATEMVLDNLSIMYWGNRAVGSGDTTAMLYMQNCEVAWGGNCFHVISQSEPTIEYAFSGDGIYAGGECGMTIINCYVHDVDGAGITLETESTPSKELVVTGNLVERCGQGIWLHTFNEPGLYQPITVEDNYVLDIGVGNVHGCFCPHRGIDVDGFGTHYAPVTIRNNLVYHALHAPIAGLTGQETLENNRLYR